MTKCVKKIYTTLNPLERTLKLFKYEILQFFLFWGPILACRVPDPDSQFGSGSADPIESGAETLLKGLAL
jgi:hypothetical protein